jgi:hypothetical protein
MGDALIYLGRVSGPPTNDRFRTLPCGKCQVASNARCTVTIQEESVTTCAEDFDGANR